MYHEVRRTLAVGLTSHTDTETRLGSDIESEDDDDEDDDEGSTRSTSEATTGAGSRALTARQAVLRNVVDSSHVSLGTFGWLDASS